MTVQPVHALREHAARHDTLAIALPPGPDPTGLILRALAADIPPGAFRMFTAAVLALPGGVAWSVAQIADASGLTHHAARMHVAALVRAELLRARRMVVRDESGTPHDTKRYFLVGGAR